MILHKDINGVIKLKARSKLQILEILQNPHLQIEDIDEIKILDKLYHLNTFIDEISCDASKMLIKHYIKNVEAGKILYKGVWI